MKKAVENIQEFKQSGDGRTEKDKDSTEVKTKSKSLRPCCKNTIFPQHDDAITVSDCRDDFTEDVFTQMVQSSLPQIRSFYFLCSEIEQLLSDLVTIKI